MESLLGLLGVAALVYVVYTIVSPFFMPVKASRHGGPQGGNLGFDEFETGRKKLDSMFR